MKKLTYIFSLLVLLGACRPKPIKIEMEPAKPELVLASQVIPGQAMIVLLTWSFSPLSQNAIDEELSNDLLSEILVENATVTIAYEGKVDTLTAVSPGIYVSVTTPQNYDIEYSLYAKEPTTGKEITAQSYMYKQVPIASLDAQWGEKDSTLLLDVRFTDPEESNYYLLNVYADRQTENPDIDINSAFSQGNNYLLHTDLLTDQTFETSNIKGKIKLNSISENDTLAVSLSNISQSYYEYLKVKKKGNDLFSLITQEPINLPTNVVGGYGFFTTHFPDIKIIALDTIK